MAGQQELVLVSGGTGAQGGHIARELLDAGWPVRVMTRKPESEAARALAARGAEIVQADLDDEESLRRAMKGAWGAVAVQNTWEAGVEGEEEQGKRFARIAKEEGIQHLLYQSVGSAHRETGIPHFDNKWRIEETIRDLNFPSWSVMRPVFFMENLTGPWFKPSIDDGKLAIGMKPDTKLQMVAVQDIGKVGRAMIERHDEFNGKSVDLAGDELTGPEAARILSEVTGRPVTFVQVPIDAVRASSDEFATMLEWFDDVGYDADIKGTAKEVGVVPTSFRDWAREQDWS